jgi:hypothetical protein
MSLRALIQNPPARYRPARPQPADGQGWSRRRASRPAISGGGPTGHLKVALEANLNLTEMCQAAVDIRTVSSLPLILDGWRLVKARP